MNMSCFTFAKKYVRDHPTATAYLLIAPFRLHAFCLDVRDDRTYTVEWLVDSKYVPFLFIWSCWLQGHIKWRPYNRYENFFGIKVRLPYGR